MRTLENRLFLQIQGKSSISFYTFFIHLKFSIFIFNHFNLFIRSIYIQFIQAKIYPFLFFSSKRKIRLIKFVSYLTYFRYDIRLFESITKSSKLEPITTHVILRATYFIKLHRTNRTNRAWKSFSNLIPFWIFARIISIINEYTNRIQKWLVVTAFSNVWKGCSVEDLQLNDRIIIKIGRYRRQ